MTETEWRKCREPQPMLAFLQNSGVLSERKARLFGVACCRRIWPLLKDDRSRQAVEVAEQFADGLTTREKLREAGVAAEAAGIEANRAIINEAISTRLIRGPAENWIGGVDEIISHANAALDAAFDVTGPRIEDTIASSRGH